MCLKTTETKICILGVLHIVVWTIKTLYEPQLYDGDIDEYLAQFKILTEINDWNLTKKSLNLAPRFVLGLALCVFQEPVINF